jgi:hypothetical protein
VSMIRGGIGILLVLSLLLSNCAPAASSAPPPSLIEGAGANLILHLDIAQQEMHAGDVQTVTVTLAGVTGDTTTLRAEVQYPGREAQRVEGAGNQLTLTLHLRVPVDTLAGIARVQVRAVDACGCGFRPSQGTAAANFHVVR